MSDARVVVVTGATRGLGRAMAARLIEEGHTVVGCGRSLSGIKELESAFTGLTASTLWTMHRLPSGRKA